MTSQLTPPPGLEDRVRALLPAGVKVVSMPVIEDTWKAYALIDENGDDMSLSVIYNPESEDWLIQVDQGFYFTAEYANNHAVHLQAAAQVADWLNANWKPGSE